MTPSQIAIAATGMKPWVERDARERMVQGGGDKRPGRATWPYPPSESAKTAEVIAERVGVGARRMVGFLHRTAGDVSPQARQDVAEPARLCGFRLLSR